MGFTGRSVEALPRRPQGHSFAIRRSGRAYKHVIIWGLWCVEEVGIHHGQEAGLRCSFDSRRSKWTFGSGSLLSQEFRRRREEMVWNQRRIETVWNQRRIEKSLEIVMFMSRVMTYVVSNKVFWNWIGVVRSVSHEVWSGKGFVVRRFLWHCIFQIVSL